MGERGGMSLSFMSVSTAGMGERRPPQELAFDEALGRKSGLSWYPWWTGESGKRSWPSDTEELGLGGAPELRRASTFFLTRPRFFSYFCVSMLVALRRAALPGFASGLIIHQELLPVPSFWTRMKRLCSDRLWRMEFCGEERFHK